VNHDGLDTHATQLAKSLLDTAFDDVLQLDDAQHAWSVANQQRRTAAPGDFLDGRQNGLGKRIANMLLNGVGGALADSSSAEIHAAHPSVCGRTAQT